MIRTARLIYFAAAVLVSAHVPQPANAESRDVCRVYADRAVAQVESARRQGLSNLRGPLWTRSYDDHYDWCRRRDVSIADLTRDTRKRGRKLGWRAADERDCREVRICSGDIRTRRSKVGLSAQGSNFAKGAWRSEVMDEIRSEIRDRFGRVEVLIDARKSRADRRCIRERNMRQRCWQKGLKQICQVQGVACMNVQVCGRRFARCADNAPAVLCVSYTGRRSEDYRQDAVRKWERRNAHLWGSDPNRRLSCSRGDRLAGGDREMNCRVCGSVQ